MCVHLRLCVCREAQSILRRSLGHPHSLQRNQKTLKRSHHKGTTATPQPRARPPRPRVGRGDVVGRGGVVWGRRRRNAGPTVLDGAHTQPHLQHHKSAQRRVGTVPWAVAATPPGAARARRCRRAEGRFRLLDWGALRSALLREI